jgi:hypothetical protein
MFEEGIDYFANAEGPLDIQAPWHIPIEDDL